MLSRLAKPVLPFSAGGKCASQGINAGIMLAISARLGGFLALHAINYEAPGTLDQAINTLKTHGENARPFCGGTDIIIQLRAGVRRTEHLVDVKKIKELCTLSFDAKKGLRLGAVVPCIAIYENETMGRHYPGLTEAAALIA